MFGPREERIKMASREQEECLAIQKIPLHQSCFYCKHCGKKLSLLNYAVLHGAFYCQAHYKQLANGGNQEETTNLNQKCQQWQTAVLLSPGLEPKTQNNPTGKILTREKMQPRLCSLPPEDGLRSAKQTRPLASQNKLRICWPPSKETAALEDAGRKLSKFGTSKKLPQDSALIRHSGPSGFTHEAPRQKSMAETSRAEKTQRLLPKLEFPKKGDCVSCWFQPEGSGDLKVLEKRVSCMERNIPDSQGRKTQAGISEKAKMYQLASVPQRKESISSVSPLTSISAKPSVVGSSPFFLKGLKTAKVTQSAGTPIARPQGCSMAKVSFKDYSLSQCSFSVKTSREGNEKETLRNTEALLKARIKLPALTKLDSGQNRKIPKGSETDTSIAHVLEEPKSLWRKPEMEDHKQFQPKSGASVNPTEHKNEESGETKYHINCISASFTDSPEICGTPNQVIEDFQLGGSKAPGNIAESTCSLSLQGHEKLPCPETLSEEAGKENEMNPEGKPECPGSLYFDPDQDAEQEAVPSVAEDVAEVEDGHLVFPSWEDSENGNFLLSGDPQDATRLGHLASSANESLDPFTLPNKIADLPMQISSENTFHLLSQKDTVENSVVQAPEVKQIEMFASREAVNGTENQPTGKVNVKSQNQDGSTLQGKKGEGIPGDSAKKTPLEKERNPFARVFASKNQATSPKKEAAGTKNVSKTQSALVTLFGYSSDKGKNKQEQPRKKITKSLTLEGSDEKRLRVENFPSPLNTEETFQVAVQSMNSEANVQSCSREEQREISPCVVNTKLCNMKNLPVVPDTDSPSSATALSGKMNLEIPKPSTLNEETRLQQCAESSPFISFQNPFETTEDMLQSCARSLVETHSITNFASSRDLYDEELSNLPDPSGQDLQRKARNISFSCASRAGDGHLIDRDNKVSDMLLFSMKNNGSMNTQERAPRFTADFDLEDSQMKDKPGHALSSSDENLLQRNNSHQLEDCGPPTATESVNNKTILVTGNAGIFQHSDQQTGFSGSAEDPFGLDPHENQATIDNYLSRRGNLSLSSPSLQCIPELLRATTQGQAGERVTAAEIYHEERVVAEESCELSGSFTLSPDNSPFPTVI